MNKMLSRMLFVSVALGLALLSAGPSFPDGLEIVDRPSRGG